MSSRFRSYANALAALVLASVCSAERARAAGKPDIPPECGSRAAFEAELEQRLGSDAPVDTVHVSITPSAERFHLRVQIGNELRELDDENCQELFRASVVVAVAMLLHDEPPPAAPATSAPAAAPKHRAAGEGPAFALAGGGGVTVGTLPPPVLTLELESQLLWRSWGVGLGLRYLAPGQTMNAPKPGVELQGAGAGVTGIFRPGRAWQARLGFAAQRLFGTGLRVAQPMSGAAWAGGPTLGLSFVPYEARPFWLGLGAEGQLNLLRGNFEIVHYSASVYEVRWLSGSAFVRLGLVW